MKRGQLALKPLIELLIAGFVIVSAFYFARDFATQDVFVKARIARDGALFLDAAYDVPGNVWMSYPLDVSRYSIALEEQLVRVSDETGSATHLFAPGKSLVKNAVSGASLVSFYKNGNSVSVTDKLPKLNLFRCDDVPRFRSGDVKMKVTEETQRVAQFLDIRCSGASLCAVDAAALKAEEKVFVKVVPMKRQGIAARYGPRSRQLACHFANTVLKNNPQIDVWLLPTDDKEIDSKQVFTLLIEVDPTHLDTAGAALQQLFT